MWNYWDVSLRKGLKYLSEKLRLSQRLSKRAATFSKLKTNKTIAEIVKFEFPISNYFAVSLNKGFIIEPKLAYNSLCNLCWPWTCNPHA